MPRASLAETTSAPRPDAAPEADAASAEGRRGQPRETMSGVLPRESSNTKNVAALVLLQSESFEFFDECRAFDVQYFCSAISISACAIQCPLNQVPLDSREIAGQIQSIVR